MADQDGEKYIYCSYSLCIIYHANKKHEYCSNFFTQNSKNRKILFANVIAQKNHIEEYSFRKGKNLGIRGLKDNSENFHLELRGGEENIHRIYEIYCP